MGKSTKKLTKLKVLAPPLSGVTGILKKLYTVPELIRLSGITRKQVSYWAQIGLLKPTLRDPNATTGRPALFYSAEDVVRALIVCEMRRAGFSPRQVQQVARNLSQRDIRLDADTYLLTDGYSVYYACSDNEVVDILRHHRQMLLLVPIQEQIEKLKRAA